MNWLIQPWYLLSFFFRYILRKLLNTHFLLNKTSQTREAKNVFRVCRKSNKICLIKRTSTSNNFCVFFNKPSSITPLFSSFTRNNLISRFMGHGPKILETIRKPSKIPRGVLETPETKNVLFLPKSKPTTIVKEIPYTQFPECTPESVDNISSSKSISNLSSQNFITEQQKKSIFPKQTEEVNSSANEINRQKMLLKILEETSIITYQTAIIKFPLQNGTTESLEMKNCGLAKLTPIGRDLLMSEYKKSLQNIDKNTLSLLNNKKIPLQSGLVKINSDSTIITTATQEHFTIFKNDTLNNKCICVGNLTSEKPDDKVINNNIFKLSDNQPISNISNKPQFFRLYTSPLILSSLDVELHSKATEYVQNNDIHEKISGFITNNNINTVIQYNTSGVTQSDLEKLLELSNKKKETDRVTTEKHIKKPLNSLQLDEELEKDKRKEKRDAHQEKQKEQAALMKKLRREK